MLTLADAVVPVTASLDQLTAELLAAVTSGNWLLAASTALWGLFFALQGKAGFTIPAVSDWIVEQSGRAKAGLVLLVAVAAGVSSAALGDGGAVGVGVVLAGLASGVKLALGAMGIQGLWKALRD